MTRCPMPTGIDYVPQCAADLRLCAFSSRISFRQFRVLARQQPAWFNFSADLNIIGASHYVTFTAGAGTLSEVLACVDPAALSEPVMFERAELDSKAQKFSLEPEPGGSPCYYLFSSFPICLHADFPKAAEYYHATSDNALYAVFPGSPRGPKPFTFLYWETGPEGLGLFSMHTYPLDDLAVCSRSTFSCVPLRGHLAAIPEGMPRDALNPNTT